MTDWSRAMHMTPQRHLAPQLATGRDKNTGHSSISQSLREDVALDVHAKSVSNEVVKKAAACTKTNTLIDIPFHNARDIPRRYYHDVLTTTKITVNSEWKAGTMSDIRTRCARKPRNIKYSSSTRHATRDCFCYTTTQTGRARINSE